MQARSKVWLWFSLVGLLTWALGCGGDAGGQGGSVAQVAGSGGASGSAGAAQAGTLAGTAGSATSAGSSGTRAAAAAGSGQVAPAGTAGSAATGGSPGANPGGGPLAAGSAAPAPAGMGAAGAPTTQPAPMNPPEPSAGCGQGEWPMAGNHMVDVDGTPREYIVKLPGNYDPARPYRLVFAWHGLGGSAMQIAGGFSGGYYGLAAAARWANEAIFIAGQGLPTSSGNGMTGGAGWPNTGGRDVAFVRKLVEWANAEYCVDRSRIFSTGMSYGGIMSNTLGCDMGDVFRAIAPMAGSGPRAFGGRMCVGQVAVWLSHGDMDEVVSFASGQASRDHWVMSNHCQMMTQPTPPDGCIAYQGCDAGHPVHWCQFAGGHTVPPFATDAIFKFFSQF